MDFNNDRRLDDDTPCPDCDYGSGWLWHPVYGWSSCAECNDDGNKPKPQGQGSLTAQEKAGILTFALGKSIELLRKDKRG